MFIGTSTWQAICGRRGGGTVCEGGLARGAGSCTPPPQPSCQQDGTGCLTEGQ